MPFSGRIDARIGYRRPHRHESAHQGAQAGSHGGAGNSHFASPPGGRTYCPASKGGAGPVTPASPTYRIFPDHSTRSLAPPGAGVAGSWAKGEDQHGKQGGCSKSGACLVIGGFIGLVIGFNEGISPAPFGTLENILMQANVMVATALDLAGVIGLAHSGALPRGGCGGPPPGRRQVAPTRCSHIPPSDARRAGGQGLRAPAGWVRPMPVPIRLAEISCCSHNAAIGGWRKAHASGEGAR